MNPGPILVSKIYTYRWKSLYHQRGAVEREFGHLKHEWGMLPLRVRRIACQTAR